MGKGVTLCWGGGVEQTTQGEWSFSAFSSWETRRIVRVSNELLSPALHFNLLSRSPGSHSSGLVGSTHTLQLLLTGQRKESGEQEEGHLTGGEGRRGIDTWLYSLLPLYLLSLPHPASHSDIHLFLLNFAYRCKETSGRKKKGTTKKAGLCWKAETKEQVAWSFSETEKFIN